MIDEPNKLTTFINGLLMLVIFIVGAVIGHSFGRFCEKHDAVIAGAAEYYIDPESDMSYGGTVEKTFRYLTPTRGTAADR